MIKLSPDKRMSLNFLSKLDHLEHKFTFQTFDDGPDKLFSLAKVLHGTFEQHADELTYLNNSGAGIFVMVNRGDGIVHDGKKTCRTNDNVVAVRALFADADGAPLEPILAEAPSPHILVESSPGKWHIYWLTSDTKLEEFKPRQIAIAKKFGTDATVNDLARVLRLPGYYHQKNEPFMTRLITP